MEQETVSAPAPETIESLRDRLQINAHTHAEEIARYRVLLSSVNTLLFDAQSALTGEDVFLVVARDRVVQARSAILNKLNPQKKRG